VGKSSTMKIAVRGDMFMRRIVGSGGRARYRRALIARVRSVRICGSGADEAA
jgi:hypothetical protein